MKTSLKKTSSKFDELPGAYDQLCRKIWLPRPIHDYAGYEAALTAIEPCWGREEEMNTDQTDWFQLVADLIGDFEEEVAPPAPRLQLRARLRGLLEAQGMNAADLGRLLGLDPGMGSKLLKGDRRLTVEHINKLAARFGLPGDFFLGD